MRTMLIGVAALLGSVVLCGCGGSSFHGTLGGNTGSGPQPEAGEPVVTGLSPASVVAGGADFTITVTGKNFAQGDAVEWGSFPLDSTFISSTKMTAKVSNQLISHPTSDSIIVQTPDPYSINFGVNIAVTAPPSPGTAGFTLSTMNVQANDIVWDPSSQQIYLSVVATDLLNPNTITALNPVTDQLGTSVSAGSGADQLSVSSDGSWLYAGIDKDGSVQRFTLPGLAEDIAISLGAAASGQPYYAAALETAPGSPNTIVVSRATSRTDPDSVIVYDRSTPRSSAVSISPGLQAPLRSLVWNASGSDIYASYDDSASLDYSLFDLAVNSDGVQLAQNDQFVTDGDALALGGVHYSALTGYLYTDDGPVIDPSTGSVINHLPLNAVGQGLVDHVLTLDDNLGVAWVIGHFGSPTQCALEAFDLRTYALLGSIVIPNVVGTPVKLIRWGTNGLAFLTGDASGPQQGDGVYIVNGAFVTTPSAQIRTAAGLQH